MSAESGAEPDPGECVAAPRAASVYARPDLALTLWMAGLTCLWGLNAVSIKVLTGGVSPIMGVALRNAIALVLLTLHGLLRGREFRCRGPVVAHAAFNGVLFAGEFICSYSGAKLANAGHFSLFINTSPFVVAIGAHYLFPEDRLHPWKVLGLCGALAGIALMFSDSLLAGREGIWRGDLLLLVSAVLWGVSILHVKGFILGRLDPFRLLYLKLWVSTPLTWLASRVLEPDPFFGFGAQSALMLAYQGGVIVFFTYLMFIVLLGRYQPSALQSFVFLTPVWGVVLGIAVLGESFTLPMAGGMFLIGSGLYLIHRPRATPP